MRLYRALRGCSCCRILFANKTHDDDDDVHCYRIATSRSRNSEIQHVIRLRVVLLAVQGIGLPWETASPTTARERRPDPSMWDGLPPSNFRSCCR